MCADYRYRLCAGIWLSTGLVWILSGVTAWLRYYTRFHSQFTDKPAGERQFPVIKFRTRTA